MILVTGDAEREIGQRCSPSRVLSVFATRARRSYVAGHADDDDEHDGQQSGDRTDDLGFAHGVRSCGARIGDPHSPQLNR